jgi:hypothetical protein
MTIRVIQVTKLESPWNCASLCQPFTQASWERSSASSSWRIML